MRRLFIVDYRLGEDSKAVLSNMGDVVLFHHTSVSGALSGHPDICIFYNNSDLICSSDIPPEIVDAFEKHDIPYIIGEEPSGPEHPDTARYNACGNAKLLIHNTKFTTPTILGLYPDKEIINIKQGYSRCSTLLLDEKHLITSDAGIAKKCEEAGKDVLLVDTRDIILPGLEYGLFGGCCGISGGTVLIAGSLKYLPQGKEIEAFINSCGFTVYELNDAVPQDVGGIFVFGEPL